MEGQVITWTLHYERFYIVFIRQMICSGQRARGKGQRAKAEGQGAKSVELETRIELGHVESGK
jgi:hypothetical protein